MILLDITFP